LGSVGAAAAHRAVGFGDAADRRQRRSSGDWPVSPSTNIFPTPDRTDPCDRGGEARAVASVSTGECRIPQVRRDRRRSRAPRPAPRARLHGRRQNALNAAVTPRQITTARAILAVERIDDVGLSERSIRRVTGSKRSFTVSGPFDADDDHRRGGRRRSRGEFAQSVEQIPDRRWASVLDMKEAEI
jgi:hypothetical protein